MPGVIRRPDSRAAWSTRKRHDPGIMPLSSLPPAEPATATTATATTAASTSTTATATSTAHPPAVRRCRAGGWRIAPAITATISPAIAAAFHQAGLRAGLRVRAGLCTGLRAVHATCLSRLGIRPAGAGLRIGTGVPAIRCTPIRRAAVVRTGSPCVDLRCGALVAAAGLRRPVHGPPRRVVGAVGTDLRRQVAAIGPVATVGYDASHLVRLARAPGIDARLAHPVLRPPATAGLGRPYRRAIGGAIATSAC